MENILYRTEIGRYLTHSEIDDNFRYVSNPWSPLRVYTTGMIIYHDIVPDKFILYRAKTTTTEGSFIITEWDAMNSNLVNVIISAYDNIPDFVVNEWDSNNIKIGDYVVLTNQHVYLLYQNNGASVSDYISISFGDQSETVNVVVSGESILTNYIAVEWDDTIQIGDIVLLTDGNVWFLTTGDGSLTSQYVLLTNATVNWVDIIGKPTSTSPQIDTAVNQSHAQDTDQYLDFGGANQVSASTVYSHINDATIHFTMGSIVIDHSALTSGGVYTHSQIDDHIDDAAIHYTMAAIDHTSILNVGIVTHALIDSHIIGAVYTHVEIDAHVGSGFYLHYQIDSHIDDISLHFAQGDIDHANILNNGAYNHSQIDNHMDDSSIHFLPGTWNHVDLLGVGINTHIQIDDHINDLAIHYLQTEIDHVDLLNIGAYNHAQIDTHIDDTTFHYLQTVIDHTVLLNIGTYTHALIDAHIDDPLLHLNPSTIDHNTLLNVGVTTHEFLDLHIEDLNIHFSIGDIDHSLVEGAGFYQHYQIDYHIDDSSIHFTMDDLDHMSLLNIGIYDHPTIDDHINNADIHFALSTISHTSLTDIGLNTHDDIDNFISNIDTVVAAVIPLIAGVGLNSVMMLDINTATNVNSVSFGSNNNCEAENGVIMGGYNNTLEVSATRSVILGGYSYTGVEADTVYAPKLNVYGAQLKIGQTDILNWYGETTNAASTEIFLLDLTRYAIPLNSTIMFRLDVVAYNTTDNVSKVWEIRSGIKHSSGGVLSLIGNSLSTFMVAEDGLYDTIYNTQNWLAVASADVVNKSLKINVTGEVGKTIGWRVTGFVTLINF